MGAPDRRSDAKLAKKDYSCSTFMLSLGVEGRSDQLAHHIIYVAEDHRRNLDEIEWQHVLSEDPSFYVENPVRTDSTMAPPGPSALYVLLPVTHQHPNVNWSKESARYRGVALRQLTKIGLPSDLAQRIRFERVVTPVDWESKVDIYRGATFNLAHRFSQMLHLRPQNRFEGSRNSTGCILWAAARIPEAACPSSLNPPASVRACCWRTWAGWRETASGTDRRSWQTAKGGGTVRNAGGVTSR